MAKKKLTEEEKATKKREFKTELDRVFIIILVLFLVCGIGYAGYTMYKNGGIKFLNTKKEEKKEKEEKGKKKAIVDVNVDLDSRYYGGYVFTMNADSDIEKVYNMKGDLVYTYEEPLDFSYFHEDAKGNVLLVQYEWGDNDSNNVYVHTISDGKDKVLLELEGNNSFFSALIKKDGKEDILIGFVETIKDGGNYSYKVHYLDGKVVDLGEYAIRSVVAMVSIEENYYLYDERYAVVSNNNQKEAKYGIMDLTNGELVVGLNYNLLRQTQDDLYIAKMDGKLGLIDLKTKKVLPYEYDFIESHDDFYVVSKDDKLAILDEDHRFVTDFAFDYQKPDKNSGYIYDICCSAFNSFSARKVGDKYLLVINENSRFVSQEYSSYNKEEAYIIDSNGKYETINEIDYAVYDDFVYFLDADERSVHFYDGEYNYMYDISLIDYDFEARNLEVKKYGENLLVIKVDGTALYFDFKTGEETDDKVAVYADGTFKADLGTNTVKFKDGNVEDMKLDDLYFIQKIGDNSYFINKRGRFVIVK